MNSSIRHCGIIRLTAIAALLLFLVGCNQPAQPKTKPSSTTEPLSSLSESQAAQREQAIDAKDKLFASLLGELTKSMGEKGPAKSISVCKTRAPEIAKAVSEETGVRIGRTSFKLRNENNTAPDWANQFVNQQASKLFDSIPDFCIRLVFDDLLCLIRQNNLQER